MLDQTKNMLEVDVELFGGMENSPDGNAIQIIVQVTINNKRIWGLFSTEHSYFDAHLPDISPNFKAALKRRLESCAWYDETTSMGDKLGTYSLFSKDAPATPLNILMEIEERATTLIREVHAQEIAAMLEG